MIDRLLILPKDQSFFLFGARNTGKSTWVNESFPKEKCLWIDLLDPTQESALALHPENLMEMVSALPGDTEWVVIDEIQKAPKLLDVVHKLIEMTNKKFILTGSSARKLKYGGANLLAGRAFSYRFYPFSFLELGQQFNLDTAINYGMLPYIYHLKDDVSIQRFLMSYTQTYLKEEIWSEQLVRKTQAFRKFLEVAAQNNGKIINVNKIAKDTGVTDNTIKEYYQILEDTLIGFHLESYHSSFRKRLSQKPKFYLFDTGITKALNHTLPVKYTPQTSMYGEVFEHFIILECMKLSDIYFLQYRFSYLKTKDDAEIDLVVERPGQSLLLIEIKSDSNVTFEKLKTLQAFSNDIQNCEAVCFSKDTQIRTKNNITIYPWQDGIKKYFTPKEL